MDIDAIIAEATPEVANEQTAPEIEASEQETVTEEAPAAESQQEVEEDIGSKPDSELTPEQLAKREWNRKSHQNSKLARQARELRELREFKASIERQQQAKTQEPKAPNLDDFDNIQDYVKAEVAFEKAKDSQAQDKGESQIDEATARRIIEVKQHEIEFANSNPDYIKLITENADFFDVVKQDFNLQNAITEADDAPLALYALMKEGNLADLYDLTPTRLAAELAKAEIRGKSYLTPKKTISNAPAPITPVKGKGVTSTNLDNLDGAALLKSIRQT